MVKAKLATFTKIIVSLKFLQAMLTSLRFANLNQTDLLKKKVYNEMDSIEKLDKIHIRPISSK